ncbi:hypothetical protein [Halostella salina]|uniref:hypothetical protein n=1 Tax=Halostella salina TaxID=1547897 RepID=UPI000EF770DB|nr:hypothetical protein [Halostella salina]
MSDADATRETKTFHRAVCPSCDTENGLNRPSTLRVRAKVDRKIHNNKHHSGAPVAEVETFDAEAIGAVPTDAPPLPGEEVDA